MAYSFASASSQRLSLADNTAFDFSTEFTFSFWSKNVASTFTSYQTFLCKGAFSGSAYAMYQVNDGSQNKLRMTLNGTGNAVDSPSGSGWGNEWNHLVVAYDGAGATTPDKVQIYKNGSSLTVTVLAGSIPASLPNTTGDLNIAYASGLSYLNGSLADLAMWNKKLSANEALALSRGMNATSVRPQSLVFYAPLVRDLIDVKGGLTITNTNGATVSDHPRIYG